MQLEKYNTHKVHNSTWALHHSRWPNEKISQSFHLGYTGNPRSQKNLHKLGSILLGSNTITIRYWLSEIMNKISNKLQPRTNCKSQINAGSTKPSLKEKPGALNWENTVLKQVIPRSYLKNLMTPLRNVALMRFNTRTIVIETSESYQVLC